MSPSITVLQIPQWMFNTAKEFSLSFPIVDLRCVLSLFKVEKLHSASQLVTGIAAQCLLSQFTGSWNLDFPQTASQLLLLNKLSNLRVRFAPESWGAEEFWPSIQCEFLKFEKVMCSHELWSGTILFCTCILYNRYIAGQPASQLPDTSRAGHYTI